MGRGPALGPSLSHLSRSTSSGARRGFMAQSHHLRSRPITRGQILVPAVKAPHLRVVHLWEQPCPCLEHAAKRLCLVKQSQAFLCFPQDLLKAF